MMKRFPAGSEWRKWDLHVHAPGSKMSKDQYQKKSDGSIDWERFCLILHDSDVAAFGITDYFSLDSFFTFSDEYRRIYPEDSTKVFFPNIELRLPEILNRDGQSVNIHIIFRPDLTREDAEKFTYALKTVSTGPSEQTITCHDLSTEDDCDSATVSIQAIQEALKMTFGQPTQLSALIVTSAKGDGIRAGGKGSIKRKKLLSDEIDKASDAFFAGPESKEYFLDRTRLEKSEEISPKPVFDGSDAHDFTQLTDRLGKHVTSGQVQFHTTWIKADLTYEGLCQTLVEPKNRVAVQAQKPDFKQPYHYISKIHFSCTDRPAEFPQTIEFNPNLNSIIGSRSSGKSALLAYIAHAVDADNTIRQQSDIPGANADLVGPAIGKTWKEVQYIHHEVEWGSGLGFNGKVIYIPQNSLYSLSERPEQVTKKIEPALFRQYPELAIKSKQTTEEINNKIDTIKNAVESWFSLSDDLKTIDQGIHDLGDKNAIENTRNQLSLESDEAKKRSELTDKELTDFQQMQQGLQGNNQRLNELNDQIGLFSEYITKENDQIKIIENKIHAEISVKPDLTGFPSDFTTRIKKYCNDVQSSLTEYIEQEILNEITSLLSERLRLAEQVKTITHDNSDLIAKHAANTELDRISKDLATQTAVLEKINKKESDRKALQGKQEAQVDKIRSAQSAIKAALEGLTEVFETYPRQLSDEFTFGIESGMNPTVIDAIAEQFNRNKPTKYIRKRGDEFNVITAQSDPEKFLKDILSEEQQLRNGYAKIRAAEDVLICTPEVRFTAKIEKDVIGGFGRSTMTPGKQALFALTLILNESSEPWPLLIDQPEDDLDSRSIYDTIVPYLIKKSGK